MRKLTIGLIAIICIAMALFASSSAFAGNDNAKLIVTYGETTHANQDYMKTVNDYFASKGFADLSGAKTEVINADQVNQISKGISGKTYDSKQIFSSALVDLTQNTNLKVTVDKEKVTLVTAEMYGSALESAGITQGVVYVTSPVSSTGESALAGIMTCYEKATNTQIPSEVKEAANEEIYVQTEVVNSSNSTPDHISKLVEEVKDQVQNNDIKDVKSIKDLVNQTAQKYNIQLSSDNIQKLADAILNTFKVQDKANEYKTQLESALS